MHKSFANSIVSVWILWPKPVYTQSIHLDSLANIEHEKFDVLLPHTIYETLMRYAMQNKSFIFEFSSKMFIDEFLNGLVYEEKHLVCSNIEKKYIEMETRKRYNTEQAVDFVLTPGSDSEMSELEESEDENDEEVVSLREPIRQTVDDYDSEEEALIEYAKRSKRMEINDDDENDENENEDAEPSKNQGEQKPDHKYRWRKSEPPEVDTTFKGEDYSLPPDNVDELTPLDYFEMFWKPELNELLAEQTNLYSVQQSSKSIKTDKNEIEQLIGIQMQMSIVQMPRYEMYWANDTKIPQVCEIMTKNRYKALRQYLHVSDNSKKDLEGNKYNKLYKIEPVLEHVRENCLKIEPEQDHSIDEQIIPAKTKYSGIRQYNPKKPVKWGFKNFVRSGASGVMYDFFIYTGAEDKNGKKVSVTGPYVVHKLIDALPQNQQYKVFFDNWFCNLDLCIELKLLGFLVSATARSDRIKKCPLLAEKDLRKQGRGSFDYRTDMSSGLAVVKWLDNKCVHLCTNYVNPIETSEVRRWDKSAKKYVQVTCPAVVKEYNKSMGGVDLSDMLISLYRTRIKTKRWYLKLLFHCVDIAKVNAWLLYRRYAMQLAIPKNRKSSLLKFTTSISTSLMKRNTVPKVGRPLKRSSVDSDKSQGPLRKITPNPQVDVRLDCVGHWPEYRDNKRKCRRCKVGQSRVYCMKCDICLCFNGTRNCFFDHHTQKDS